MTKIVLNLGLDKPTFSKHTADYDADYLVKLYLDRCQTFMQHGIGWKRNGDTLIASGRLMADRGEFALHRLAAEAGQDCVAAWYPTLAVGKLYGPFVEAWGHFDLNEFKFEGVRND